MMGMTLIKYIIKVGDKEAAKLFNVKPRTVASWRRGEHFPRSSKAQEIVLLTKCKITMADIYDVWDKK